MNRIGRSDEICLSDARAKAHKMKQMVTEGGDPKVESHRFKDVPTFGAFVAERYLPYAKTRKRSRETDEIMLRHHLLPPFGEFRMNRITRSDVVTMHHAAKEKGYAAGTCNRMRYLTQEEVGRLFDELDRNRNVQVAQVIRLLLYTGARKREILDAKWEHIDFNRRFLMVPLSKSGKPRYIPLSDAANIVGNLVGRRPVVAVSQGQPVAVAEA